MADDYNYVLAKALSAVQTANQALSNASSAVDISNKCLSALTDVTVPSKEEIEALVTNCITTTSANGQTIGGGVIC